MTTPITPRWLLEHGFVRRYYNRYVAELPDKVNHSITIYYHYSGEDIDFLMADSNVYISGTLKEGTAEELQKYIDVCNLSDELLNAFKLKKGGNDGTE